MQYLDPSVLSNALHSTHEFPGFRELSESQIDRITPSLAALLHTGDYGFQYQLLRLPYDARETRDMTWKHRVRIALLCNRAYRGTFTVHPKYRTREEPSTSFNLGELISDPRH